MPPMSLHYGLYGVVDSMLPSHIIIVIYVQGNIIMSQSLSSPIDLFFQPSLRQSIILGDIIYLYHIS